MRFKKSTSFLLVVSCGLMLMVIARSVHCEFTNKTIDLTLDKVQVVFRHGERTPHKDEAVLIPSVGRSLDDNYGFAQLTRNGKRQEYNLGRMLRERYNDFLGDEYQPSKVFSLSSNTDRTKASLQLVLASLFPPVNDKMWTEDLKWDPIPTNSVPWELDNFFNLQNCPKYTRFYGQLMNSNAMKKKLSQYEGLLKFLSGIFPNKKMDLEQIFYLNNLLHSMKIFNNPLPKWSTKELDEEVRNAAKLYLDTLSYNPNLIKLNGGAMAKRILGNMLSSTKRKIYLYSGHEFTVYALAKAHNVTLDESPPFGSAIILEQHKDNKKNYHVRMYLWTGPSQKLVPINLGNCGEFCTLKEYYDLVKPMLPQDEDMRCLYKNVRWSDLEKYFNYDKED